MDARNNRREPRVKAEIAVVLQMPRGVQRHVTANLSYRGVFILSQEPLPLRKLVRFHAVLKEGEEALPMLGLVAHRVNRVDAAEQGIEPGMGIQLFGSSPDARELWRQFVRDRYDRDPAARQQVRSRELPKLRLRFNRPEDIAQMAEVGFASGPVQVRSADLHPVGSHLQLDLIHPGTGAVLSVETIVAEVIEAPRQQRGMMVALAEAEEATAKIIAFAK
jgi:hypothetical protein